MATAAVMAVTKVETVVGIGKRQQWWMRRWVGDSLQRSNNAFECNHVEWKGCVNDQECVDEGRVEE